MQTGSSLETDGGHPIAHCISGKDAGGLACHYGEPFADRMGSGQMGGSIGISNKNRAIMIKSKKIYIRKGLV